MTRRLGLGLHAPLLGRLPEAELQLRFVEVVSRTSQGDPPGCRVAAERMGLQMVKLEKAALTAPTLVADDAHCP